MRAEQLRACHPQTPPGTNPQGARWAASTPASLALGGRAAGRRQWVALACSRPVHSVPNRNWATRRHSSTVTHIQRGKCSVKQPVCLPNHLPLRRQAASSWYTWCCGLGTPPVPLPQGPQAEPSGLRRACPFAPPRSRGVWLEPRAQGRAGAPPAPGLDPGPAWVTAAGTRSFRMFSPLPRPAAACERTEHLPSRGCRGAHSTGSNCAHISPARCGPSRAEAPEHPCGSSWASTPLPLAPRCGWRR